MAAAPPRPASAEDLPWRRVAAPRPWRRCSVEGFRGTSTSWPRRRRDRRVHYPRTPALVLQQRKLPLERLAREEPLGIRPGVDARLRRVATSPSFARLRRQRGVCWHGHAAVPRRRQRDRGAVAARVAVLVEPRLAAGRVPTGLFPGPAAAPRPETYPVASNPRRRPDGVEPGASPRRRWTRGLTQTASNPVPHPHGVEPAAALSVRN